MEENNIQKVDLKEKVLDRIKSGNVHMKSKAHFVLKIFLIVFVVILILVVSAFIISYVIFSLKTSGQFSLLGFGTRGVMNFIIGFPWLIFLADCLLLVVLDYLLKNFRFGYHSPKVYLFLGTFAFIMGIGLIIELTPLHGTILRLTEEKHLPFFDGFYGGIRKSHSGIGLFHGTVVSVDGNSFTIKYSDFDLDRDNMEIKVDVPNGSNATSSLKINDTVFVAGSIINGEIQAYGLQKLPNEIDP